MEGRPQEAAWLNGNNLKKEEIKFFYPTASGTKIGTLTITDNAGNSPQIVTLTGRAKIFL
jgi:hypothetical protein